MASWMVHLRLAEKLLDKIDNLDAELFGIGNIAPDSGVPDEKWQNFDPPKEITHLQNTNEAYYWARDLEFYRTYLAGQEIREDRQKFSFLLGYFFHLVTDNLWTLNIWRPSKQRYLSQMSSESELGKEVKYDWYGLDFRYVLDHPDCFFWRVFKASKYPPSYLAYFPEGAIEANMDYIKKFYSQAEKDIPANYRIKDNKYLTSQEMDAFILESTETLYMIYYLIWEAGVGVEGMESALELLKGL